MYSHPDQDRTKGLEKLRTHLASSWLTSRTDAREHLDWSMEIITRQMQHLSRLIDDLMDVSRITRGKIELKRAVMDATPILDSAAATVGTLI